MPILIEKDPIERIVTRRDPGLDYMEWQKSWSHRNHWDIQEASAFIRAQQAGQEPSCRPKSFDQAPQIQLPRYKGTEKHFRSSFEEIFANRKTDRNSSSVANMSLETLGAFLQLGYGVKKEDELSRFSPSPGALYSLEIYLFWPGSKDLEAGLYHYHSVRHCLEKYHALPADYELNVAGAAEVQSLMREGRAMIFISSVFGRMRRKYGAKYLRFCLIETGAAVQSFYVAGAHLGVGVWAQGIIFEKEVNELLMIDGQEEAVLTGFVFGTEAAICGNG